MTSIAALALGCFDTTSVLESGAGASAGGSGSSGGMGGTATDGAGGTGGALSAVTVDPKARAALEQAAADAVCTRGGRCELLSNLTVDELDLLFAIDDTASMAAKQEALREQLPRLMQVLVSGDADGDGANDFPPVRDIHLGVVTADMGVPGVVGVEGCSNLGDDGVLRDMPFGRVPGVSCQPSYTPFLKFTAGVNQPLQTATDLSCIASVGTSGCVFTQPLEAQMKALGGTPDERFLDRSGNPTALGHGNSENAGFLRVDEDLRLSTVRAVVVFTDKDDCSSSDTHIFTPPADLAPDNPLSSQGMKTRCHFNQTALYPIERYLNGLQ